LKLHRTAQIRIRGLATACCSKGPGRPHVDSNWKPAASVVAIPTRAWSVRGSHLVRMRGGAKRRSQRLSTALAVIGHDGDGVTLAEQIELNHNGFGGSTKAAWIRRH
jgi:hypothetical protein